jgi:hypothetical protein
LIVFSISNYIGCVKSSVKTDATLKSQIQSYQILPSPKKVNVKENIVSDLSSFDKILLYKNAVSEDRFAASLLKDKINELFGNNVSISV